MHAHVQGRCNICESKDKDSTRCCQVTQDTHSHGLKAPYCMPMPLTQKENLSPDSALVRMSATMVLVAV